VTSRSSTIVIGGGISGLTCAYALRKVGIDTVVLEASSRPGGVIRTEAHDGFLFECGPQSFSSTAPLLVLIRELGLEDQMVQAPSRAPRYVLIKGKLTPVPLSPPSFVVSPLLSWRTKWSILRDPLGSSYPPEHDESISAFVRRKFTPELLDRLAGPFVSGIYAGDPEALSLRGAFPQLHEAEKTSGSILRGMMRLAKSHKEPRHRPILFSFREGNETLVRRLAEKLGSAVQFNVEVREILRTSNNNLQVNARSGDKPLVLEGDRIVLSTPTGVTSGLMKNLLPACESNLKEITYAPVVVVSLGYRRSDIGNALNGFGFLVPRSAGLRTLGTVWNSSLFPGRAPENRVLLTSFVGGALDPAAIELSREELVSLVHRELSAILGIRESPLISHISLHPRAIPQYNLGHAQRLAALESARSAASGIWFTGNYFRGPAIGSCLETSLAVAEAIRVSFNP
jgi:protoporphyrinogen/coproporphyrinogen III oxidase